MIGLTVKQKTAIDFIERFSAEHSYAPTFREISAGLGIDIHAVYKRIQGLTHKGYLTYTPGKQRTLRVIKREEQ